MTEVEQAIREVIASIPDLSDRVFLLIMIRNHPIEVSNLAGEILKPLEEGKP